MILEKSVSHDSVIVPNSRINTVNYTERSVGNKVIVWLKQFNQYMVLELSAYEVIRRLVDGNDLAYISVEIGRSFGLPLSEAQRYVGEIATMMKQISNQKTVNHGMNSKISRVSIPTHFHSLKSYKIKNLTYRIHYGSAHLEHLIHSKFAYLENILDPFPDHQFQVFQNGERSVLQVNGAVIGQWLPENDHFLSGKLSMELLNTMYGKTESDWMGVFHASAISNKEKCLLFLGESGSGKSTVCAVLMAAGFNLLADDFVPVDGLSGTVYHFPAALSVKKSAIDHLLPFFPELARADEFTYPAMDKAVRFLPPAFQQEDLPTGYPCKALVFVKYKKHSGIVMKQLSKDIAFQKLVPDSWISPVEENAIRFLDWFLELPCYQLTYSDNDKMVNTVQKIFNDDL